jgi:hypothetical protein
MKYRSRIIPIIQFSDFLDGSDLYRLFCVSGDMYSFFHSPSLYKLATKTLAAGVKSPRKAPPPSIDEAVQYTLSILPIARDKIDSFVKWYIMKLVLYSAAFVKRHNRICYYCKRMTYHVRGFSFANEWRLLRVTMPNLSRNIRKHQYNIFSFCYERNDKLCLCDCVDSDKFTICMSCQNLYIFTSLPSFCSVNGIRRTGFEYYMRRDFPKYRDFIVTNMSGVPFAPIDTLNKVKKTIPEHLNLRLIAL